MHYRIGADVVVDRLASELAHDRSERDVLVDRLDRGRHAGEPAHDRMSGGSLTTVSPVILRDTVADRLAGEPAHDRIGIDSGSFANGLMLGPYNDGVAVGRHANGSQRVGDTTTSSGRSLPTVSLVIVWDVIADRSGGELVHDRIEWEIVADPLAGDIARCRCRPSHG